jgi:CO/xanthine dehydrogenase Mo-binding subunit
VGEPGLTPTTPAILNAITDVLIGDLSGVWIPEYKLPVLRNIFKRVLRKALNP